MCGIFRWKAEINSQYTVGFIDTAQESRSHGRRAHHERSTENDAGGWAPQAGSIHQVLLQIHPLSLSRPDMSLAFSSLTATKG